MSDEKPKLPEMPDFFKQDEPSPNSTKNTPPPIPPKVPNNISPAAEVKSTGIEEESKRKFSFGKSKSKVPLIEFRNDAGEMVPSEAPPKTPPPANLNDYFPPLVGQVLAVLLLIAVGTGLFYYYQADAYKNRYQAMDTRVLSFTKEIASLNQENNSLSGKIVNYQKEGEDLKKQITELQAQIVGAKSPTIEPVKSPVNADPKSSLVAVTGTPVKPIENKPVEAADPVPQSAPVTLNSSTPTSMQPTVAVNKIKATDPSVNYESQLKTKGEQACLQYYKTENLKKCQGRDTKYSTVAISSKNTPTGAKLNYQCQGVGVKPLNFKYGPMEIYNNCVGR